MTMSLSQAWRIAGEDLRYLPLIDRNIRLRSAMPKGGERLVCRDYIQHDGEARWRNLYSRVSTTVELK